MSKSRPAGRPSSENALDSRKEFINSGREHFSNYGFKGASFTSIAASANYTPTAIRHHFPEKGDLYAAVFSATSNTVHPRVVQHLYSETLDDAINKVMKEMVEIENEFPTHMAFLSRAPYEFRKHPELRNRIEVRDNFHSFFFPQLIELGRSSEELPYSMDLSDETLTVFFFILLQGWIYESHYSRNVNLTLYSAVSKLIKQL